MQHDCSPWNTASRSLWQRIQAHPVGGEAARMFHARLAREQGWSSTETSAAIAEYQRFCLLATSCGHEVTPSEEVDAVWHLHLLYTRDYWQHFCTQVLGGELHHGPTRGAVEEPRFREAYARTLQSYEAYFGTSPERWWPAASERFARRSLRRFDPARHWLLPRPRWPMALRNPRRAFAAAIGAVLASTSASAAAQSTLNPLDWNGPEFLELYGICMLLALLASIAVRMWMKAQLAAPVSNAGELSLWETAWLAGGAERVVDTGIAELHRLDKIRIAADGKLVVSDARHTQDQPLDSILDTLGKQPRIDRIVRDAGGKLERIQQGLEKRGLWFDPAAARRIGRNSALPWLLVAALGAAKILVGVGRDRPVLFIAVLTIISAVIAIGMAASRPQRSAAGSDMLARLNARHASVRRAPRAEQLGLAVALVGTTVLTGTALAAYHQARQPASSGDASSTTDSSSSSDSDGGGSSGCGGCGGGGD